VDSPCKRPRSLFSKIYLKYVALPVPEITAIRVLGGVVNPNVREEEAIWGRGWYRSKEHW